MDTVDILKGEREKLVRARELACVSFDNQIAEIDVAIDVISERRKKAKTAPKTKEVQLSERPSMSIDDAIVEAVKNDNRTPANILLFLDRQLGINTTINSVRTRVSRLKSDGKIARGDDGWIMPDLESLQVGLAPEDEAPGFVFPLNDGENE